MELEEIRASLLNYLDSIIQMKTSFRMLPAGIPYVGIEDFVRQNGREFITQPYPNEYLHYRGKKKECFFNAYRLAQRFPNLIYVEGYAIGAKLPIAIHHAFCVDSEGKVIDPTWDDQEDCLYYGVEFNQGYVLETSLRRKYYGILENWEEGNPLLMGKPGHSKEDFSIVR